MQQSTVATALGAHSHAQPNSLRAEIMRLVFVFLTLSFFKFHQQPWDHFPELLSWWNSHAPPLVWKHYRASRDKAFLNLKCLNVKFNILVQKLWICFLSFRDFQLLFAVITGLASGPFISWCALSCYCLVIHCFNDDVGTRKYNVYLRCSILLHSACWRSFDM